MQKCKYCDCESNEDNFKFCEHYGKPLKNLNDNVKNPNHYQLESGEQTIDVIASLLGGNQFKGYCKGNIIKYLSRYDRKNGVEDLKKAKQYIDFLIDHTNKKIKE